MKKFNYHDYLANYGIGSAHPGGFELTKKLLPKLKIQTNTRVLDVGCGTGRTAAYIKKKYNCQVTGLDLHPLMLEKAKTRFKKEELDIELIQGSIENLPFQDQSFDVIIAESVTVFNNIERALLEYSRVLKPNGLVMDLDMTLEEPLESGELKEIQTVYGIKEVLTESEWKKTFSKAGLPSIKILESDTIYSAMWKQAFSFSNEIETNPSEEIDPELDEIRDAHQNITFNIGHKLGYRVYLAQKK